MIQTHEPSDLLGKTLRGSAYLAAACVVAMIAIFVTTGVGQDPLQFVHPEAEYAKILLARPGALRATIGFDNAFICFYSIVFVALYARIAEVTEHLIVLRVGLAFLLALPVLDMIENFHFLVMLARAEENLMPSGLEIGAQVWESLLKFHVSYIGMLLLGLALPRTTKAARALAFLSVFVQMPVGVLIYVTPREIAVPLVFVRFSYFLASLVLAAIAFGSDAPARSPSTTPVLVG